MIRSAQIDDEIPHTSGRHTHESSSRSRTPARQASPDHDSRRPRDDEHDKPTTPVKENAGQGTAEKAGVILGIHNIFVVVPQFLVTFLSAIIFQVMEPTRPALPSDHVNPHAPAMGNVTVSETTDDLVIRTLLYRREVEPHVTGGPDSVGLVFRLGGISAAVAGYLCLRMARQWRHDSKRLAPNGYTQLASDGTHEQSIVFQAPPGFNDDDVPPPATPLIKGDIQLGLDTMKKLVSFLPPMDIPYVHIAGTNGKGSVSAMVDSCLCASGLRTGRYNSPHLVTVRDAVLVNGKPVSSGEYTRHRTRVESAARDHGIQPSEFEVATATAFSIFTGQRPRLDVLIIECGMGGLRDATNVLDTSLQLCAVLTTVDLDHQKFLGDTIEAIATDKLGICCERGVLVVGKQDHHEVYEMARQEARGLDVELVETDKHPRVVSQGQDNGVRQVEVTLDGVHDAPSTRVQVSLPLVGEHQLDNLATALAVLSSLEHHPRPLGIQPNLRQLSETAIHSGIRKTTWPGRCSWLNLVYPPPSIGVMSPSSRHVDVLVDGAHNTSAATRLKEYINELGVPHNKPITYIISLSHSPPKTPASVLEPLLYGCRSVDKVIPVAFSTPVEGMPWVQPVPVEQVRKAAIEAGIWPENVISPDAQGENGPSLVQALQTLDPHEPGLVVVTGSLYLVADAYRMTSDGGW